MAAALSQNPKVPWNIPVLHGKISSTEILKFYSVYTAIGKALKHPETTKNDK